VQPHDDHFAQNTPDAEWLVEVGRRGCVVLTKDMGFRQVIVIQKYVARLDVSMHDILRMQKDERPRKQRGQTNNNERLDSRLSIIHQILQGKRQPFQDHVRFARWQCTAPERRYDIRVLHRFKHKRFIHESTANFFICRPHVVQYLDRHGLRFPFSPRFINQTHPARGNKTDDNIFTKQNPRFEQSHILLFPAATTIARFADSLHPDEQRFQMFVTRGVRRNKRIDIDILAGVTQPAGFNKRKRPLFAHCAGHGIVARFVLHRKMRTHRMDTSLQQTRNDCGRFSHFLRCFGNTVSIQLRQDDCTLLIDA